LGGVVVGVLFGVNFEVGEGLELVEHVVVLLVDSAHVGEDVVDVLLLVVPEVLELLLDKAMLPLQLVPNSAHKYPSSLTNSPISSSTIAPSTYFDDKCWCSSVRIDDTWKALSVVCLSRVWRVAIYWLRVCSMSLDFL